MSGTFRSAVLALLVTGAVAAPAQASVVSSTRTFRPASTVREPLAVTFEIPALTTYGLTVAAGPGEANSLTFELTDTNVIVRDAAGITPGGGCTALDAGAVACDTPPEPGTERIERRVLRATLGDGDDAITLPPSPLEFLGAQVDGADGNDTILGAGTASGGKGDDLIDANIAEGGPGEDRITAREADGGDGNDALAPRTPESFVTFHGGAGDDVLVGSDVAVELFGDVLDGGAGDDQISAGAGDDRLNPGPGADVSDGGPGVDFISFADTTGPVRADLATPGPIRSTGEGDVMSGIESVEGGSGEDVLLGADGDSVLIGGDGDDRLDGRGGRDIVIGGRGADLIDGGTGADDLTAGTALVSPVRPESFGARADAAIDRVAGGAGADKTRVDARDHVDGGAGNDLVTVAGRPGSARCGTGSRDRFDGFRLPRDCERIVWFGGVDSVPARTFLRGGRLSIRVPGNFGGRVTVTLSVDGRRVASGSGQVSILQSRVLHLPVDRRGRRALLRARSVRVELRAPGSGDLRVRDVAVLPAPR